jgi:beta-lactamase superfamily II metal-dependent hydrolase
LRLKKNRSELMQFLAEDRWRHVWVLQVPHHGSRNNWEIGAASEFTHGHSVFCADETHRGYQHPHREVVIDLIHRGPVLANKQIGWTFHGNACFK